MIRGIDTQMMLQQTVNAARVAGEKAHESDQMKEFQAQLEQERAANEMETVQSTEAAEHRRIENEDDDGQRQADYEFEQQHQKKREHAPEEMTEEISELEARAAERMKKAGVGGGLDISV